VGSHPRRERFSRHSSFYVNVIVILLSIRRRLYCVSGATANNREERSLHLLPSEAMYHLEFLPKRISNTTAQSSLRPAQKGQLISVPNYRSVAISPRDKLDRLLFGMINLFGFIIFVCSACIVFASAARGEDRGGDLSVGTDTGITRAQFAVGYTEFDHKLGLPKGFVTGVIKYQGKIHATTQYGVYVLKVLKALEDAPKSPEFLRFGDESNRFFAITVSDPNAFAISDSRAYALNAAGSKLERIGAAAAHVVPSRTDSRRLDRHAFSKRQFAFHPSQIVTADGKRIPIHDGKELTLEYDDPDFHVGFGTDHFSVSKALYCHTTVEGTVGHPWPAITAPAWRSGALNKGRYLISVETKDSDGVEGEARWLAFTIEPPSYRPLWIEVVSLILALLTVCLFIRWRTWQMTLRQRQLVQMVDLRTRELHLNELELRKAKDAAELERERAETANRAKTAFLADISHELRTPLNSILGYVQILLRRREPSDDVGAKLKTILDSGEHLLEMTNEALDLSRIESRNVAVALRSLELPKFIAGIVEEFRIRVADRRLRFIHEIQGEPPQSIETDPLRLRKVLYNLLGNAVKFTSQGEIAFRVYVSSERLRFEVKDTGKGIPREDLPSIFKPFYQSSNNQLIGQGVGLGLHISKQIVELLGGEISIESELGHGSTFSFEIPRRDADPVNLAAPSPQIRNYEGQRRKILVVDDEPLNRSMLRELLSTVGLQAAEADSPEKAFSLIKKGFDAVISDIRMPGYDGHTFCRNLRSSAETKDLVIIACSASVFADDQRLALDSGFSDFLAKPVMEEELFGVLGRHLKLRWKYKEVRG
jgi:signal transduction histidine kinase/CheY-like chemotaxis protein